VKKEKSIKKRSIILVHGIFDDGVFKNFKKSEQYFVLEGRPDLLSSKGAIKALTKKKILPTVIADNMAGFLFYKDLVKEVRLSYQYDDESGVLCDIGALILGVLGKTHKVPVHLYPGQVRRHFLAPQEDLLKFNGKAVAAPGTRVYAPLVEWLANEYITKRY
jgi:translation initiation factor 2B subunit (eIF-2B alpha/beta/delta family)